MPLRPLRLLWAALAGAATATTAIYAWNRQQEQQQEQQTDEQRVAALRSDAPTTALPLPLPLTTSGASPSPLHSNPLLCSSCRARITPPPHDDANDMTATDECAAAAASLASSPAHALDAPSAQPAEAVGEPAGNSFAMSPTAPASVAISKPCASLPACLDPLLELFRQRSLPLPRIRMLSDPHSELPQPYFDLLHHPRNMTPTLSHFWMDQEVRLRVLCKREQRQPTDADPHGTLQRWITLQVDQPVHRGCSDEVKERFRQQQAAPTVAEAFAAATPSASASATTPSSSSCSPTASGRQTASDPSLAGHADSVQQVEAPSTVASATTDVDTMRAVCDAAVAAHERALLSAQHDDCATALLPPHHASAVLAAKAAMDEAVAAYEAALMLAHEHADSPVAPSTPVASPSPSPSPPSPPSLTSPRLVEFGSIRVRMSNLPASLRDVIWAGQIPFATALLQHRPTPIQQIIRPQAFFAVEWDRTLTDIIGLTNKDETTTAAAGADGEPAAPLLVYGRCNYIFSGEEKLICEVVEIMPPILDMHSAQGNGVSKVQ